MVHVAFFTWLSTKKVVKKLANFYLFNCLHFYVPLFWLLHYFYSNDVTQILSCVV